MGTVKELPIDELRTDGGLQLRARIDQEHVERLAEAFAGEHSSNEVPAIQVLFDSKAYWVWDGNHRILGAQRAGRETIRCQVEKGTQRDAILKAAGANHNHGLPRSSADKRCAVRTLLADKTWRKRSDRWIADACKVSHPLVADVRRDLEQQEEARRIVESELAADRVEELPVDRTREGKNGKTYQASPKPPADEALFGSGTEEDPVTCVSTSEKLQDLLAAHGAGKLVLNPVQLQFVTDVVRGRVRLRGKTMDQALQLLDTFWAEMHVVAAELDEPEFAAANEDRAAWVKERVGWLWEQYRAKFGERAAWMYFLHGWEAFSITRETDSGN
jgi:uncharacterized ParB-like nuclease family protein